MDSMAQTRVPVQQQRDHDLTGSDEFLTDEKLDSLWEWFCDVGNEDKFHSQLIFAKLVNAARKPYRDNLSLPQHCDRLFTPGTSRYASSEYTSGYIEEQQHPEQSEDKVTIEALSTKLAIAEDSAHTKQTIIKYLEGSLQTKQMIINQLEAQIKDMEQELGENKLRHEGEKKQLELDLTKMQQEYLEYKEKEEVEKMQLESKLTEMDQMLQEYKQKVEGEKKQLELDLKEVRQEYLEYKETEEGARMQLESKLKEMDQSQQEYKQKVEGEKEQLELDLKKVRQEYLEYKEKGEGERMQSESKLKEMNQTYQDYKQKAEGEKTELQLKLKIIDLEYRQYKTRSENEKSGFQSSLQQLKAQHEKCGKIEKEKKQLETSLQHLQTRHEQCDPRFVLKFEQHYAFISSTYSRTVPKIDGLRWSIIHTLKASTTFTEGTTFTLENHPDGKVSFRATTLMCYLSVNDYADQNEWAVALKLRWSCGGKEMFCLHEDDSGGRYIEPVDFPGKFLSACPGHPYIVLREGKSAASLFYFIAR